jgi:YHS domain-containing protein
MHRFFSTGLAIVAFLVAASAHAADPVYLKDGVALSGYDAVSYFTEARPVKGSAQFEHQWNGVRWRFASSAHLKAFAESPEKYAPQYGGYCAYGVSRNHTVPGDPEAWKIVNGRLFLNYDKSVRVLWEKELPDVIRQGDSHWPSVLTAPAP